MDAVSVPRAAVAGSHTSRSLNKTGGSDGKESACHA